jgi:hypothetical protein
MLANTANRLNHAATNACALATGALAALLANLSFPAMQRQLS